MVYFNTANVPLSGVEESTDDFDAMAYEYLAYDSQARFEESVLLDVTDD